jgi:hypothetical protein
MRYLFVSGKQQVDTSVYQQLLENAELTYLACPSGKGLQEMIRCFCHQNVISVLLSNLISPG